MKKSYLWNFTNEKGSEVYIECSQNVYVDDVFQWDKVNKLDYYFVWNFFCENVWDKIWNFPHVWNIAMWWYNKEKVIVYYSTSVSHTYKNRQIFWNYFWEPVFISSFDECDEKYWSIMVDESNPIRSADIRIWWYMHDGCSQGPTDIGENPTSVSFLSKEKRAQYIKLKDKSDYDLVTLNLYNHSFGTYVFIVIPQDFERKEWRNELPFIYESRV